MYANKCRAFTNLSNRFPFLGSFGRLVSDLTIQNGTRSARAIVRRRIMQTEVARMMATPLIVRAFSATEDFGLNPSAFLRGT
jgi:hypothetical protein